MLHSIKKIIKDFSILKSKTTMKDIYKEKNSLSISISHLENVNNFKRVFSKSNDIVIREFEIGHSHRIKTFVVFIDGLVDKEILQADLMKPLMLNMPSDTNHDNAFNIVKNRVLTSVEVKEIDSFDLAIDTVLSGDTVLFLDGYPKALMVSIRGWATRNITEPNTEVVVRGPREGFTETLRINTSQIRRRIKNPNLKFESMKIGRQTKTEIAIAYIEGIVNEKIVDEAKKRLNRIDTDSILESGYIEEFIEDAPFSFLPTVGNSEKPDVVAAKILEGRVAILTDGTPFVLTVPYLFVEAFQSSEDYYSRPFYVTLIRWIRIIAYFICIFAPALYVAITTFHQEMLPPALLISMAAAREGTPFPVIVEALGMGIIFEILREAGIRLPRPVGQAVSIVGALVIGESAVTAGLIGAPMVIVVAITAISSFVVSTISDTTSIMRLYYVVLSGFLGLFGIMIGAAVLLTHMVSLRSFGIPYLSPLAPTNAYDLKDALARAPWWAMFTRPHLMGKKNLIRQKFMLIPSPSHDDKDDGS